MVSDTKKDLGNAEEEPMLEVRFDHEISFAPHSNPIKLDVRVRCWKGSSVEFKDVAVFHLELSGNTHGPQTEIQGGLSGQQQSFVDIIFKVAHSPI